MQVTNKTLRMWNSVIADIGITAVSVGSGVNFRMLKKAVDYKVCSDEAFDKIQAFMLTRGKVVRAKNTVTEDQD